MLVLENVRNIICVLSAVLWSLYQPDTFLTFLTNKENCTYSIVRSEKTMKEGSTSLTSLIFSSLFPLMFLQHRLVPLAAKVCDCALQQWVSVTHSCTRSQLVSHVGTQVGPHPQDKRGWASVHLGIYSSSWDFARAECHLQSNPVSSSATLIKWVWYSALMPE